MNEVLEQVATQEQIEMIESFQCPGCTIGGDTKCGSYDFCELATGCFCVSHSAGTMMGVQGMGIVKFALGLPKGFNRVGTIKTGFEDEKDRNIRRSTNIRLIVDPSKHIGYDKLNVPVWGMEKDGYLFVRVMCPRINYNYVDVIKCGTIENVCPNTIDVGKFWDEID